ncbi:MAG: hypothetical protein ACRDJE_18130 [Dehalococcoidia bacterium]
MTQITDEQKQQLETAATSVAAKLERFQESLSSEERFILAAALQTPGMETGAATGDVAGHAISEILIRAYARAYVGRLPIWGSLQQSAASLSGPIDGSAGFDGSPPYSPQ